MDNFFIPEELYIIGAAVYLKTQKVTDEQLNEYIKLKRFRVEYDETKEFQHCKYDKKKKCWNVTVPQLSNYILSILL